MSYVVVPQQNAIEVYLSADGYVAIYQRDDALAVYGDAGAEATILVRVEHADALAAAIVECAENAGVRISAGSSPPAKDTTAAVRQRRYRERQRRDRDGGEPNG